MEREAGGLRSMTGYGAAEGGDATWRWRWEARSVNGRSLDLRLRLPEGWDGIEPALRSRAQGRLRRGAVTVNLRVSATAQAGAMAVDALALAGAVAAVRAAADAAAQAGLAVAPVAPERLAALRGVLRDAGAAPNPEEGALTAALADFDAALTALDAARAGEGAALGVALSQNLDRIAALLDQAEHAHAAQAAQAPHRLREKVAALVAAAATPSEERLAAELALLAVRADVREELDRLSAHIAAARALLARGGGVGRELDFLTQEFNREANTLCAKAASTPLTKAGLALKVQIDQLREQAANLE